MMEQYTHTDAYNDVVDILTDLALRMEREEWPSNRDLDELHYALQVENSLRQLNGAKLFED